MSRKQPPPKLIIGPREEVKALPQLERTISGKVRINSLNELEVLEKLGQGSEGIVEKWMDRPSGDIVAVKKVKKLPLSSKEKTKNSIIQHLNTLNSYKNHHVIYSYGSILQKTTINII